MAKIVLDPGHGGDVDIGGSSWNNAVGPRGTLEKKLVLDIGLRAADALRKRGHEVVLTRQLDVNLGLRERAQVARRLAAPVFVSIHLNASTNGDAQGTESFVHSNYSARSAQLSLAVQDAVLKVTGHRDRNESYHPSRIKPMALGVLNPANHAANTAACLSEASFMDRADEEERLLTPAYRTAIAEGIAAGIVDYLDTTDYSARDTGDPIETEAAAAGVSVERFLGLDVPEAVDASSALEGAENSSISGNPFSTAFLTGQEPSDSLTESLGPWPEYAEFSGFIHSLNLRFFEPDEFLFPGHQHSTGKCRGKNTYPPKELWGNIRNTALMVDEIRERMGAPIRITSCYRSRGYNDCIGGAQSSQHLRFNAIDFTCRAGSPEIWRRVAEQLAEENPAFRGWIGVYSSFVHIDTRRAE